ncbi:hypothetical protein L6R52_28625 [Myxococcota bacterium]|nr:hypothetical protein [Myxococcota bacterium]
MFTKLQKTPAPIAQPQVDAVGPEKPGACAVDRGDVAKNETKSTEYAGTLAGRVGLSLEERSHVEIRDVELDGTQRINFGDVRVVEALAGKDCQATRTSTTLLEIPFEIVKNGAVRVNLEAFTEIIARAQGIELDASSFGTTAPAGQPMPQPIAKA